MATHVAHVIYNLLASPSAHPEVRAPAVEKLKALCIQLEVGEACVVDLGQVQVQVCVVCVRGAYVCMCVCGTWLSGVYFFPNLACQLVNASTGFVCGHKCGNQVK